MTSVHIHLYEGDGTTDATGYVIVTPTTRRDLSAGGVALPVGKAYTLVDGEATMTLAPSGLTWCWEIREMTAAGTTRYISVVDSPTTVEYEDCADVDLTTLEPTAQPEAAWWAAWNALAAGTYMVPDPANLGLYIPTAGTSMVEDPANDGLYTIGALA